jgi:hypothetical protein
MFLSTTVALTLFSAAALASAGTPADTPPADVPLSAAPVQFVDTPEMDGAAIQPTSCAGAESEDALFTPVDVESSDFTLASQSAKPRRGYCRCSCSFTPDCSTNADCGGSLCLKGPTCC